MNDKPNLASEQDMDRAVGHALSWWNHVEDALGDVFCATLGSINTPTARAAYLAVINFNARLKMVDGATTAALLRDDLVATWRNLFNRADTKSGIRNKLTHFSRMSVKDRAGNPVIYLMPNFWEGEEWRAAIEGKGKRYTWPQVWEFGQSFGQLAAELKQLAWAIDEFQRTRPRGSISISLGPAPEPDTPNGQ